ncbi:LA_0442/LA_0875 N-terminal domain-containing protein [Leptospira weilii]
MKKIISYSILVFLLTSASLGSETLLLKSGKKVEGRIVDQDKETVTFKLADGTTKVFQKSNIRKISFSKIAENPPKKEETQKNKEIEKKKSAELALNQKSKLEKEKKRERELIDSKRHFLEVSFGIGNGTEQSELRPFFQTIQYAGLAFSSSGQAEILTNPYKTPNNGSTTRIRYAWNRFTFELRGTQAKHNFDVNGFQTLAFGTDGSGSGERAVNAIFGEASSKFQKVSSRIGFTPYPHPVLDLQILGGIERIWTKTDQEVDSLGPKTASGINPNRISFREYSSHHKGYSFGVGFEWKFLKRFTFQGQILHLNLTSPSSFKNYEYRIDSSNAALRLNQFGLDYWWKSKGTEINLKLSANVKGNWSVFVETSHMTLKNTLQSGYITEDDGGNQDQLGLKIFGPRILIPMLHESKTILTYVQFGVNHRFDF